MNLYKKYLSLLIFSLFANLIVAQKDPARLNELDKTYEPSAGIFSADPNSKKNQNNFGSTDLFYGLKFMPFELSKGNLVFENELNIPNTSINLTCGLGYNVRESYFEKNGLSFFLSDENGGKALSVLEALNNGIYQTGGAFVSFGYKSYARDLRDLNFIYSDGEPFNGLYSFFSISHYSYNYTLASNINNYKVTGSRNFKVSHNCLNYGIGYSAVTTGKIKTIHDFYIGMGLKVYSYTNFKLEVAQPYTNGSMYLYDLQYIGSGKKTDFDFSFTLGYSFGIGF